MPHKDPEIGKRKKREYYQRNKSRWKNPDGTWKTPQTDTKANSKRWYYKNRETVKLKQAAKIAKARLARTKPCPICGDVDVLVYDHNHQTGLFRHYICQPCNLALGHAKENPFRLRRLAEYAERDGGIS